MARHRVIGRAGGPKPVGSGGCEDWRQGVNDLKKNSKLPLKRKADNQVKADRSQEIVDTIDHAS